MNCIFIFASLIIFALNIGIVPRTSSAITIPTVPVGNAGNRNDTLDGDAHNEGVQTFGAVAYSYRIGTTEVTNAQYVEFLNAKGKSDSLALYNANMGSSARGGITRSGVSGTFTYETKVNMGNKPVNFVSWYDSIRFANWLNNGQGTGDTETGAYTLLGGTAIPSNGQSIIRNGGAKWFLPSENEWYKAAYYQPQGGPLSNYWYYPTATNIQPNLATANSVGDISNPGANVVNFYDQADWNGQNGNVTTVGSAGPLSRSFYGTSDQGGNVWEWNEALTTEGPRCARGGGFTSLYGLPDMGPEVRIYFFASGIGDSDYFGFRVAGIASVPEPSTLALAALGVLGLLIAARRKLKAPTP